MPRAFSIAAGLLMLLGAFATFIWLIIRSVKRSDDPAKLIFKWVLTFGLAAALLGIAQWIGFDTPAAAALPFIRVALGGGMGIIWAPNLGPARPQPITSTVVAGHK